MSSNDQRYVPGMITSLRSKYDFRLSSWQADNQLAGKSILHMQTLGYHGKMRLKYVITAYIFTVAFFWITSDFTIYLMQLTSKVQSPITFLFVNKNIKCG